MTAKYELRRKGAFRLNAFRHGAIEALTHVERVLQNPTPPEVEALRPVLEDLAIDLHALMQKPRVLKRPK